MSLKNVKTAIPWPLIVLFLILSAASVVVGFLFYKSQENQILTNKKQELSSIADLKAKQIIQWRKERIADGLNFRQNISLIRQFSHFLTDNNDRDLKSDLMQVLKALVDNYDYRNALFVDRNSNVKLFYPNQDTVIGDYLKQLLPALIRKGDIVVTDLHRTGKVSFVHLDLLVPLNGPEVNDTAAFGALVLRIDPERVLYPLIQSWPSTSKTSEALLFHREGNEIVYLNELRHLKNTVLTLRRSINEDGLVAAMALRGIMETSDAVDYRGVKVVAAMKKIPESSWYLVAKVDREEIFSTLRSNLRLILIIILLFILATGLFIGFLWWNQRVRYYRQKYEAELDHLALVRHFDYILKYANDIIILVDKNFIIVEANDKALETYQYDRNEFIDQPLIKLLSDISIKNFEKNVKVMDEAGYSTFEALHKRKDGSVFPIEISARRVDIEGNMYYQSISRDITERKYAEEILRESEEKFRKIFEESPISMVMTGKDMGIISANPAFCKMMGFSEEELLGSALRTFTHPDHISGDEVTLLRLVAEEIPVYQTEKRYIRRDGSIIWGSTTVSLIRNNFGEFQFSLTMIEDITSRKIAESELEKSFSLQEATLESTADGILVIDAKGKVVKYNQKFVEMWKIPEELLQLKEDARLLNYVHDQLKDPDNFIRQVKHLYSEPEEITSDILEFADGRFFERYSQPQKIGGKTVGRVWSFRDITSRKKAEAEIIAAKEKAEESDRLKTAFLHNVSHEIRTPMNAIMGFSTLLNDPGLTVSDRSQFTEIISQSGNQLLSIINDIVDLASIESGQMKINIRKININSALRSLCEQFSYKEKPQKIILGVRIPLPDDEAEIMTDGTKLVQILSNLVNNAFKFTVNGRIDFGYEMKEEFLEFFVKDTGIGIPPEYHSRIFERFYQVDNTVSRQYTGTGLGLSICKAYVELLGGTIWLNSKPGEGTTFYFTIPYIKSGRITNK